MQSTSCLTVVDLTALGVGSTAGAGIYMVAGQVAKNLAGPAVVLSFFISGIATIFAGINLESLLLNLGNISYT